MVMIINCINWYFLTQSPRGRIRRLTGKHIIQSNHYQKVLLVLFISYLPPPPPPLQLKWISLLLAASLPRKFWLSFLSSVSTENKSIATLLHRKFWTSFIKLYSSRLTFMGRLNVVFVIYKIVRSWNYACSSRKNLSSPNGQTGRSHRDSKIEE